MYFLQPSGFCRVFKGLLSSFQNYSNCGLWIFCKSGSKVFILGVYNLGTQLKVPTFKSVGVWEWVGWREEWRFLDSSVEINFKINFKMNCFVISLNFQKLFKTFFCLFYLTFKKTPYQIINKPISLYCVCIINKRSITSAAVCLIKTHAL